jgi:hypothetical protein
MAVTLNREAVNNAEARITAGDYDSRSAWEFTADDGNEILGDPPDWNAYGKWFLGIDGEANEETKDRYKYPFGKGGIVYRSGLIAIRVRSAQQGEMDIFNAAGALIEMIDNEDEKEDETAGNELILDAISRREHFKTRGGKK